MDFNKELRQLGDDKVVNKDIVYLEDRNIDDIIVDCYSNIYQTKLVAYSLDAGSIEDEFECEFKSQLDKLVAINKSKLKNTADKNKITASVLQQVLNLTHTDLSIDIRSLHNQFKILKLKYIVDPAILKVSAEVDGDNLLYAIDKTLEMYEGVCGQYRYRVDDTYEYLLNQREEIIKKIQEKGFDPKNYGQKVYDLFVKEQKILVPMYNGDGKYTIDDIKYYGVFNDRGLGYLTKKAQYGVKVFKNGTVSTIYLFLQDNVLYALIYGEAYNIFHILTDKSTAEVPYEKVFPDVADPKLKEIFMNTYEQAKMIENKDPKLMQYKIIPTIPDSKGKNSDPRASAGDIDYKRKITNAILDYYKVLNRKTVQRVRQYEFLGSMTEELYKELNNKKVPKRSTDLKVMFNRINLSPLSVLKVIKKGSGDHTNVRLFNNTSTEPNPFDMFYIFAYMKSTGHSTTERNKHKEGAKLPEEKQWLNYDDSKYLGEFSPKSEKNIGKATTLRVGLSNDCIEVRKGKYASTTDTY